MAPITLAQAVPLLASALVVAGLVLRGALWVYRTNQRLRALESDVKRLGAAVGRRP